MRSTKAWALQFYEGGIAGKFRGIFFLTRNPGSYHDGMRTALFRTRSQARAAENEVRTDWSKELKTRAKAVRVKVTIEEA